MGVEGLLAGRLLLGRYRVDAVLGRGGMGVVYRATDTRLDREVALKAILESPFDAASRDKARARFKREAVVAARLHHPNVVRIYDFGTDAELDLDVIVMELLQGRDLAGWMSSAGVPPLPIALDLLVQAARGLGAGHRLGLVHRDVKPANLFVSSVSGRLTAHVLDFGIVEMVDAEGTVTQLTAAGFTPHSRGYASPEQLRGGAAVTPASDIYSLGVTAFELLTGERAFSGEDLAERGDAAAVLSQRMLEHSLPPKIVETIAQAVSARLESRHPDGEALANALEDAVSSTPPAATIPLAHDNGGPVSPTLPTLARSAEDRPVPVGNAAPHRRSRRLVGSLVALGILILVGGIAAIWPIKYPPGGTGGTTDSTVVIPVLPQPPPPTDVTRAINGIRADYQRIQKLAPSLQKQRVELKGYSAEGGYADLYVDESSLHKAVVTHFAETMRVVEEHFFRGNQLIFVHRRKHHYDQPFGKVQRIVEDRFYFDDGRLIRWRDNARALVPDTHPAYTTEPARLLALSTSLVSSALPSVPVSTRAPEFSARQRLFQQGVRAYREKRYAEALRPLTIAAESGDSSAQLLVGFMYNHGLGVRRDYGQALRWYRTSAEQGNALANNNLGWMYDNGWGVQHSDQQAVRLYREAAERGIPIAQNNLGRMYEHGLGVPRSKTEAARWFRLAADRGFAKAQKNLAVLHLTGDGVPRDSAVAAQWLAKAAAQGDEDAQQLLSHLGGRQ